MSQDENSKTDQKNNKAKNISKSKNSKEKEKQLCHIHDEVNEFEINNIRENVCVNDGELFELNEKLYCLFHFPTDNKDKKKFADIWRERLLDTEKKINEIEKLSKLEKKSAKEDLYYNFAFVWFPIRISFSHYTFRVTPDFSYATFSNSVSFEESTFNDWAYFKSTNFLNGVDFNRSQFSISPHFEDANFKVNANFYETVFGDGGNFSGADFESATFNRVNFQGKAEFEYTTFHKTAWFDDVVFEERVYFNSAEFKYAALFVSSKFKSDCNFTKTKFSKVSETTFENSTFFREANFNRTRFRANVRFVAITIEKISNIIFNKTFFGKNVNFQYCTSEGYLRFSNLRLGNNSKIDFQEAAFEKAARVSFHTVRLQPNWFVNVDSRKFVFTNIDWKNINYKTVKKVREARINKINFWSWKEIKSAFSNPHIKNETSELNQRGIKNSDKRLLEIACRQLAVNAEENNRYEEASKFRYMAMETKRLENKGKLRKIFNLHWFYKWSSGYGESWRRALIVLILILLIFGIFYEWFGVFETSSPVTIYNMVGGEGYGYSLSVASFQRPEPKAVGLTKLFVILETIFAPLQAALLALAIRRKFMR